MSAQIIINIAVENPANLAPYQALARPAMEEFGIKLLGKSEANVLEGQPPGRLLVLLEAPSLKAAQNWFNSATYTQAIKARKGVAEFTIQVIEL